MSARAAAAGVVLVATAALLYGCSGDDKSTGTESSPTNPSSSSGGSSSGGSSSGSSGTSSSGSSGTSSGSSGTSTSSGGSDAGTDGPATNCVPKGYGGNDKKIGAYCDKDVSCPFQLDPFLVCTAGHTDEPNLSFCTAPCSKDSECGTGAYCMKDPKGNGCVPAQCGGKPGS